MPDENSEPAEGSGLSAAQIIELLELEPHPEGGHFRETFRDTALEGERSASTASMPVRPGTGMRVRRYFAEYFYGKILREIVSVP